MGDSRDNTESVLVDLQTRLAFQDQTLVELNAVITDQQRQIDKLNEQLSQLNDKLKALEASVESGQNDEKPPHY